MSMLWHASRGTREEACRLFGGEHAKGCRVHEATERGGALGLTEYGLLHIDGGRDRRGGDHVAARVEKADRPVPGRHTGNGRGGTEIVGHDHAVKTHTLAEHAGHDTAGERRQVMRVDPR